MLIFNYLIVNVFIYMIDQPLYKSIMFYKDIMDIFTLNDQFIINMYLNWFNDGVDDDRAEDKSGCTINMNFNLNNR